MRRPRFGLTILELVVAICAVVIIFGVLLYPVTVNSCRGCSGPLKDKTQLKQIHQGMLVYAGDHEGRLPRPGLIDRLPDPELGIDTPTTGPEDISLNHSAPLYSALIAMGYINTAIVIGPTEVSDFVQEDLDYFYDVYDPAADVYWDDTFTVRIDKATPGSNTSYAHLALCGERRKTQWRETGDSMTILLSNRGPKNGASRGTLFAQSPTLQLHGDENVWVGNVVFADNHVDTFDDVEPPTLQQRGMSTPFNLFRMDGGALGICIASTEDDVTRVWDPIQ